MFNSAVTGFVVAVVLMLSFAGCGEKSDEKASADKIETPKEIKITKGVVKKNAAEDKSKSNSGQFYYSYNKSKKNAKKDDDEKRRTTLDAYLNIRSPYERVMITMMIKKLSKDFIVKCSPCHDDYANGVIGPSLLDKNGTFIYERIQAFKTGKKENVLMKQLVNRISDEELKAISEEIAVFNRQIKKMRQGREK